METDAHRNKEVEAQKDCLQQIMKTTKISTITKLFLRK